MRTIWTLVLVAVTAAIWWAVPQVTGRTWPQITADAEARLRELSTTTVRPPPQAAAPRPGAGAPAPTVTVSQPVRREIVDWDEATGRFEAVATVDLRARVGGYLDAVRFTDGQEVAAGDVLFEIDPRPFERALAQARAELEQARTRIANASLDVERAQSLVKQGVVSEKTFDDRANLKREAEALAKIAEERVRTAELDLSFTRVVAPVAGRIGRTLITPGNYVTAGGGSGSASTLASIVVQDPIHIHFEITEAEALKFKRQSMAPTLAAARDRGPVARTAMGLVDARVEVRLADETAFAHAGRLDFVDNRLDAGTGTLRVRAVLDNPTRLFTPGQFARVRLAGSEPYVANLVPDTAIGADQAMRFVIAVGPDDTAVRKAVTLGPLVDGLRVIRSGLDPDDWVVTRGLTRVRPGQKLAPRREPLQVSVGDATPAAPVTR
jgi:multidrug efflux system membrane fusion protein